LDFGACSTSMSRRPSSVACPHPATRRPWPIAASAVAVGVAERRDGTASDAALDADWLPFLVVDQAPLGSGANGSLVFHSERCGAGCFT
jgi:hypothetical protein